MRQFCDHQIKCVETPEGKWDCAAHLAEARVFLCSYTEADIVLMDRYMTGKLYLTIPVGPHNPQGTDADFEPLPELKDELWANTAERMKG